MRNLMVEAQEQVKEGKYMAGILNPLDHSIHIFDACLIYDGNIDEAIHCVQTLYGHEVFEQAWLNHIDKVTETIILSAE